MSRTPGEPVTGLHHDGDGAPPLPVPAPVLGGHHAAGGRGGHGGHSRAMWLMCVPMLLIAGVLLLSGSAGLGAAVYALACLGMMAAMMLFMSRGAGR